MDTEVIGGKFLPVGTRSYKALANKINKGFAGAEKGYVILDLDRGFVKPKKATRYELNKLIKSYEENGYMVKNNIAAKEPKYIPVTAEINHYGRLSNQYYEISDYTTAKEMMEMTNKNFYDEINKMRLWRHIGWYNEAGEMEIEWNESGYIDDIYLPGTYVKLRFIGDEESLPPEFRMLPMDSFRKFNNKLREIEARTHSVHGSDVISYGYQVDRNWFMLQYTRKNPGGGAKGMKSLESKWYENKNIKSSDNNCLLTAVKIATKDKRRSIKLRKELEKISKGKIEEGTLIQIEQVKYVEELFNTSIAILSNDKLDDYLYGDEHSKVKILIDKKHYSWITGEKKKRPKKKEQKEFKKYKVLYLIYDLETLFNRHSANFLFTNTCSWFTADNPFEFIKSKDDMKNAHFEIGDKCVKKLLDFIKRCPADTKYKIIGFNNSKFDNFFLASEAAKDESLKDIFYVNNSILDMKIGRHSTFDVRRFLPPNLSLKEACKAFGCEYQKIDGFSHEEVQKAYEEGVLDEWMEKNKKKIEEYNKMDVLCLWDLATRLNKAINIMTKESMFDHMTIGSFAWKYFQRLVALNNDLTPAKDIIPRAPTYKVDNFVRKAVVAGRTQAYFGKQMYWDKKNEKDEYIQFNMVDAKSLYPTVMINNEYPIGEMIKTNEYKKGKMGIYKCKIDHQKAKWKDGRPKYKSGFEDLYKKHAPCIIPKRDEDKSKPLDWTYRKDMEVVLCSVDIEQIIKYCGEEAIEIGKGYYWKNTSKDMFQHFMLPFKNEKTKQDVYKSKKGQYEQLIKDKVEITNNIKELKKEGDKYNPALREFCKLIQNSLSGKVIQRNFDDYVKIVKGEGDIDKFEKKVVNGEFQACYLANGIIALKGKLSEEESYKSSAKPAYLGVFIYAYARKYMYETILNRYITLYQDTDSALMPDYEYKRFVKEQDQTLPPKGEYGSFEMEITSKRIVLIAPKNYLVVDEKDNNKSKRKFKGVKPKDTYMLKEEMKNPDSISMSRIERYLKKGKPCLSDDMFIDSFKGKEYIVFTSQLQRIMEYYDVKEEKGEIGIKQTWIAKHFNGKELE